jgi:hypothetical protein
MLYQLSYVRAPLILAEASRVSGWLRFCPSEFQTAGWSSVVMRPSSS